MNMHKTRPITNRILADAILLRKSCDFNAHEYCRARNISYTSFIKLFRKYRKGAT